MEQLVTAVMAALQEAGIACTRQTPMGVMPKLKGPVTAVCLAAAKTAGGGMYDYLGLTEDGQNLYGRMLEAEVRLTTLCPRTMGSALCQKQTDEIAALLSGRIPAVALAGYSVGECSFDAASDCFTCQVTAQVRAYVYATSNDEETEFLDFMLKGEVR